MEQAGEKLRDHPAGGHPSHAGALQGSSLKRPEKTVWAIRLPDNRLVCKIFNERPTRDNSLLKDGEKVSSGPYVDIKTAMFAERADIYRAHLFRACLEQGIFLNRERAGIFGRYKPTKEDVSAWTGYSVRTIKSWLQPLQTKSRRSMPLAAMRHIVLEFKFRDESAYDWGIILRKVR